MSRSRTAAVAVALGTLSALMWAAPTASAAPHAAARVPCVHPTIRTLPKFHSVKEPQVTTQDLEALPPQQTTRSFVKREVAPSLPSHVVIPTYVHVIRGRHRNERPRMGPAQVRQMMAILNGGYSGGQSSFNTPTRYSFTLAGVNYRKNEGWYHAYFFGKRDRSMKRHLHRGNARTLNIYINGGGPKGEPVLGWSRFPWQYAASPKLDSVSINRAALPGGSATGYNLGDTVIHETGHWLGLFHTFQNGCEGNGDLVPDTPAEAEPSFYCDTSRDTCPEDPGLDPVHNFMDYSLDSCMNQFTPGQVRRMDAAWAKWRQHG
ncbi:MAG: zinc metalloprotease [Marmoricola sp.]|nr:zinc metalloprotease [Marmoricola sp.]